MTDERLVVLIRRHPTTAALSAVLGLSLQDVRRLLDRLLRAGLVTRTRRGGSPAYHYTAVDFRRMPLPELR